MTYYIKQGNTFRVTDNANLDIKTTLPVGTYQIGVDMMGNIFLETIDDFEINHKTYGDHKKNTKRILSTFARREYTTGVLLSGEKGCGKTLLARQLSIDCAKDGIATIVINKAWHGDSFNSLMQSIDQPTMLLFDEFEKTYEEEDQEKILTLLDGTLPSKKLFVFTCNDKWRVNQHMRNRPGRIFYAIEYRGLANEFIREYCDENLNNKTHIDQVCIVASMFTEFNFDMLKSLVEEMNRYNENAHDAMKMLNAKPEYDKNPATYDLSFVPSDTKNFKLYRSTTTLNNVIGEKIDIHWYDMDTQLEEGEDEEDRGLETARFKPTDLKAIDPVNGTYKYVNSDGDQVTLTKQKVNLPNYLELL